MLVCEKCGDTYWTDTPELYKRCESCGGKLINKTPQKNKNKKW